MIEYILVIITDNMILLYYSIFISPSGRSLGNFNGQTDGPAFNHISYTPHNGIANHVLIIIDYVMSEITSHK